MKHLNKQCFMQLPNHDLTLEAAWPQLFVDHKGKYWDVPETLSVDLSSLVSDSGLRYHLGIHKNGGNPQAINATDSKPPLSLLPGLCAKAAFTYQKTKYLWRDGEVVEDLEEETRRVAPYDVRLQEPHAAVSGIIGNFSTLMLSLSQMRIHMFILLSKNEFIFVGRAYRLHVSVKLL